MVEQLLRPVPSYTRAPCHMQRAWSAHNSMVDSVRTGKTVVYKPACDLSPAPKAVSAPLERFRPVPASWPPPAQAPVEIDRDRAGRVG